MYRKAFTRVPLKKTKPVLLLFFCLILITGTACLKKDAELSISSLQLSFDNNTDIREITIKNEGYSKLEWDAYSPEPWIGLSQSNGSLNENDQQVILVTIKRESMDEGVFEALISINSNGGNKHIKVIVNNGLYEIRFFNAAYTPVNIRLENDSSGIIPPSDYLNFAFAERPEKLYFNARTAGYSSTGKRYGHEVIWDEILKVDTTLESPLHVLNVPSDYFFLEIVNNAPNICGPVYINADSDFQIEENVLINSGSSQRLGYYDAIEGGEIRIYYSDMLEFNFWLEGDGYQLYNQPNQFISIINITGIDTLAQQGLQ